MSAMKADAEAATGYKSQIDALTKEKARLEKAIADGAADAETAKALKQAKADLANITTQYNELNTKYTDIQEAHKRNCLRLKSIASCKQPQAVLSLKPDFRKPLHA